MAYWQAAGDFTGKIRDPTVSSLAFGAHCLMPVKGDVAAWRARPSGPNVWADALVRRMYPGKRRG